MKRKKTFGILTTLAALVTIAAAQSAPVSAPAAPEHYFFYHLVLLRRPANAPQLEADARQKLQEAHLANIRRLALKGQRESGKMAVGGPFRDGPGGLLIFATTPEEASQIVAQDPFVLAGEVKPEVHPWQAQKGVLRK